MFFYIIQNYTKSKVFCIIMEIFVIFKAPMFFFGYNTILHCQSYTVHSFHFQNFLYSFVINFFNISVILCRNSEVIS